MPRAGSWREDGEAVARFCEMWDAGILVTEIAAAFGISTSAASVRALRLELTPRGKHPSARRVGCRDGRTMRACLDCRQPFASAGFHNRVCDACKHQGAWKTGGDWVAEVG